VTEEPQATPLPDAPAPISEATEEAQTEVAAPPPPPEPAAEPAWGHPPGAEPSTASDRPELAVGAAFAGGFLLAMILKRLAR
jgi:hypothetical protein